jgi:adenosine deaminase
VCGARRIGHATRLVDDPALMDDVGAAGIAIEACLTSNVQTRAIRDYASHPARRYLDHGLKVTLNTDNRLMSRTTLTDEFHHAVTALDFSLDDACRVARTAFECAFLPDDERRALVADADAAIAEFRRDLSSAA